MGIEESTWIQDVYEKIWDINNVNKDTYEAGEMKGKMDEESMETEWYQFGRDMRTLFYNFYRYIPEPARSTEKEYWDGKYPVKQPIPRTFRDTWEWIGVEEETNTPQIRELKRVYEKYLAYVGRVNGKIIRDRWNDIVDNRLHAALNLLRPFHKNRQARFELYKKETMGGQEAWNAREKEKQDEREASERARRAKEKEEEATRREEYVMRRENAERRIRGDEDDTETSYEE
jgi:hypothetical protein